MSSAEIAAYRVHVPDEVLADLRERLARTRWPDQLPDAGWDYGTERGYLRELCEYWRTSFDWRAAEARLNAVPQFTTSIGGQNVHFLHLRSPHRNALPLLLSHGWPGSVVEFLEAIGPLANPPDPADAFHVVVPSLPGYGFSGPTGERGFDGTRIAETFAALMARLGYGRYIAQGGDWGALITRRLAALDAEHVAGIHLNAVVPPAPKEEYDRAVEAGEPVRRHSSSEMGYYQIQRTKPQTLAYALNDSPAGLAGWVVEKFRRWSDCDGDVERSFTKDELLTNITLYWVTGTIGSSSRLYYEESGTGSRNLPFARVEVPTGFAAFPKELSRPPRSWVESEFDLVHWTEMPRGGHFAALEEPELFVEDVRAFARLVR